MNRKVLVTYASKYGATAQIAEKIGEVLSRAGLQVDVSPVDRARDIGAYGAVVLGSALYVGKWHKGSEAFLTANEKVLSGMPVWLFSSGPTGQGDPLQLVEGQRLPPALQPVIDRIRPRGITVFHGYMNPAKMNFIETFAIKNLVKKPLGDFRDWDMIVAWANQVGCELKDAVQV